MQNPSARLESLTALRFFAAAMIVVHHMNGILWPADGPIRSLHLEQGVSFFFVLSGFVLHLNYRRPVVERRLAYGDYMLRRWLRLWPAHVAALLFALAMMPRAMMWAQFERYAWWELGKVVFLLHSLDLDETIIYAINPPSWSISTELAFYIMLPLLTVSIARHRLASLLGCTAVFGAYMALVGTLDVGPKVQNALAYISPFSRFLEFALGIWLCEGWLRAGATPRSAGATPRSAGAATIREVASIGAVALAMSATESASLAVGSAAGPILGRYVEVAFAAPAFALLIYVFAHEQGALSRWLRSRPLVVLGEISFGLYLIHLPLLYALTGWPPFVARPLSTQVAAFAVLGLGTAWALHRFVEQPGIHLGKRVSHWLAARSSA